MAGKTNKTPPIEEKAGKWVVQGMAVIALVVVSYFDLTNTETVSPFVYGGLVGALVGVDAARKFIK